MTMKAEKKTFEQVIRDDGRYPAEAYAFLHEGLNKAVMDSHGDAAGQPVRRHVTGQQICIALRELAIDRWGQLARAVLTRWNVRATMDFGNMVYLLISNGFMNKTEEDSLDDFRNVYCFDEAFCFQDEFELKE